LDDRNAIQNLPFHIGYRRTLFGVRPIRRALRHGRANLDLVCSGNRDHEILVFASRSSSALGLATASRLALARYWAARFCSSATDLQCDVMATQNLNPPWDTLPQLYRGQWRMMLPEIEQMLCASCCVPLTSPIINKSAAASASM
jgi:hypothetical protein